MPKTFTDDIAPVLPSAIDGPFQIVDPSDSSSYMKVDPKKALIQAAGGARPIKQLTALFESSYSIALSTTLGGAIRAKSIGASNDAGFYCNAFALPGDMDVSGQSPTLLTTSDWS
jgi:hypothetical protein